VWEAATIMDSFRAAVNTLKASWWELTCARLFGTKFVGLDRQYPGEQVTVTGYSWRGKWYMTDSKTEPLDAPVDKRKAP
jgi:hypothetical protein